MTELLKEFNFGDDEDSQALKKIQEVLTIYAFEAKKTENLRDTTKKLEIDKLFYEENCIKFKAALHSLDAILSE